MAGTPSCAIGDAKMFAGGAEEPGAGTGLFAEAVLRRCRYAAAEDESRLADLAVRHHFLVRLFAWARFRGVREHLAALLDDYRREWLPLSSVLSVLRAWAVRSGEKYLLAQRLFEPYPSELMAMSRG